MRVFLKFILLLLLGGVLFSVAIAGAIGYLFHRNSLPEISVPPLDWSLEWEVVLHQVPKGVWVAGASVIGAAWVLFGRADRAKDKKRSRDSDRDRHHF